MRPRLADLVEATGGRLEGGSPGDTIERISIDSRSIARGETFWALRGPRFRGEDFIPDALARGAGCVVCQELPGGMTPNFPCVVVEDAEVALGDFARWWRRVLNIPVVALSGSAGKTTTKEMLAHIARGAKRVLSTEGNRNDSIGLPLTLLSLERSHEIAVVELGMNHPDELTLLAGICEPDYAVVTNIGNAHVGNFGSEEELMRGEAEVFDALRRDAVLIVNADCARLSMALALFPPRARIVRYGLSAGAHVRAEEVERIEPLGYKFKLVAKGKRVPARIELFGRFQIGNALAAAAAALELGLDLELVAERLATFQPPALRAQVEFLDGICIVADCYNASLDPMTASLRSLADVSGSRRRIALIGEMLEVGAFSEAYHRRIAEAAAEEGYSMLCCVGHGTKHTVSEARARGLSCLHFSDSNSAAEFLARELRSGDALLVKGSRGNKLEICLERLRSLLSAIRDGHVHVVRNEEVAATEVPAS